MKTIIMFVIAMLALAPVALATELWVSPVNDVLDYSSSGASSGTTDHWVGSGTTDHWVGNAPTSTPSMSSQPSSGLTAGTYYPYYMYSAPYRLNGIGYYPYAYNSVYAGGYGVYSGYYGVYPMYSSYYNPWGVGCGVANADSICLSASVSGNGYYGSVRYQYNQPSDSYTVRVHDPYAYTQVIDVQQAPINTVYSEQVVYHNPGTASYKLNWYDY